MTVAAALQPPTSRLPPIATLATRTPALSEALQYLHALYLRHPQVRGSRRRRAHSDEADDTPAGNDSDDIVIQRLQSDAFERAYAIRWLTALIAKLEARQNPERSTPPPSDLSPSNNDDEDTDTDTLIQQAASLLAICAGVAAAGKVQRRFTFQSPLLALASKEGSKCDSQIHVLLTDIPLDNHDYASVGAQTWGGACVLAEMIAERPDRFGLLGSGSMRSRSNHGLGCDNAPTPPSLSPSWARPLRILELGAGTGLVGLTVAKLLQALPPCGISHPNPDPALHHPQATVLLTDFYPAVLDNLQSNLDANFPPVLVPILDDTNHDHHDPIPINVHSHPLDWSSFPVTTEPIPDVLSTPFDVVFGADIVYEAQHAIWIRNCLQSLLAYPHSLNPDGSSNAEDPTFHLVVPLRPTHAFESGTIEAVFGAKTCNRGSDGAQRELIILSKELIVCEAYGDGNGRRDDDVEYVYYRIGWSR